jgi:hypothetical protein
VNFFIKFDELEAVPKVKSIFINGELACVEGLEVFDKEEENVEKITTTLAPFTSSNIKLSELIANNSKVTQILTNIDNVRKHNKKFSSKIYNSLIAVELFMWKLKHH